MYTMDRNGYFQLSNKLVKREYESNGNYLIIDNPSAEENVCAIYFSSHSIYVDNTEYEFRKKILKRNKYEWFKTRVNFAKRNIFVRDIHKQFYFDGINLEANGPEKLADLLKKNTEGYKIITIGSSAGGYAAMLFGSMLKADYAIVFSAQFSLLKYLQVTTKGSNPVIEKNVNNNEMLGYMDIRSRISELDVYYFVSKNSEKDIGQIEIAEQIKNVKTIMFNSKTHDIPCFTFNLPIILGKRKCELDEIFHRSNKKVTNKIMFSISLIGLIKTVQGILSIKIIKGQMKNWGGVLRRKIMKFAELINR